MPERNRKSLLESYSNVVSKNQHPIYPLPTKGNHMAQSKTLTVKVSVVKVIEALETKLAQVTKDFASQEGNEAKFDKLQEVWKKQASKIIVDNFSKAENIRIAQRYDGKTNIDFDVIGVKLPEEPQRDFEVIQSWKYNEIKEEIENALRVLRMTDEEVVSTSTMKSISQYL